MTTAVEVQTIAGLLVKPNGGTEPCTFKVHGTDENGKGNLEKAAFLLGTDPEHVMVVVTMPNVDAFIVKGLALTDENYNVTASAVFEGEHELGGGDFGSHEAIAGRVIFVGKMDADGWTTDLTPPLSNTIRLLSELEGIALASGFSKKDLAK